jgi:hypothetical protein
LFILLYQKNQNTITNKQNNKKYRIHTELKHSKRGKKRTKTHVFSKDPAKFVTGLRHSLEKDRRYPAREHILVVLVECQHLKENTPIKLRGRRNYVGRVHFSISRVGR